MRLVDAKARSSFTFSAVERLLPLKRSPGQCSNSKQLRLLLKLNHLILLPNLKSELACQASQLAVGREQALQK